MINENVIELGEKIVRRVTPSGNGAHVFTPKEWIDEEVIVVRASKLNIKKEILMILEPYMGNVISAFIFGSYARGEQNEKSDIDVLVIANKKIKINKKGFEIIIILEDKIKKAFALNPILMYSAASEGVPIINMSFLEYLRREKLHKGLFKEFVKSSEDSLASSKWIIELDKEQGLHYTSDSAVYSLFMRLRGIFILDCLLNNYKYSNNSFKNWILKKTVNFNYKSFYSIYTSVRDNKKTTDRLSIKNAESLVKLLETEIKSKL